MNGWDVVKEFMDVLRQRGRRDALYRGQSSDEWSLTPSIFRPGARGIGHVDILNSWKRRASYFANPLPQNDIEWLILAQHYGLATALLDWTTNPLVALFFACDGHDTEDKTGCVWWIRQRDFEHANHTMMIDPFAQSRNKPFLVNAIGRNVRSTAQDSYMSLHTENDCHSNDAYSIFVVRPELKRDTILTLEKLGLTSERLHSDITRLVAKFKSEM